jgi:lon-related putative ATP-dependent protease
MKRGAPLDPAALYRKADVSRWTFDTTADLTAAVEAMGQARANEAVHFGINMRHDGYNLFVLEPPGVGGNRIVRGLIAAQAATEPVPPDWCYVYNFEQPHRPKTFRLPAGTGVKLRDDMEEWVEDLRSAIPAAFDSEEYRARRHEIEQAQKERQEKVFEALGAAAAQEGIALMHTPTGMAFAPMKDDKIMSPDEFGQLPEDERRRIQAAVAKFREQLERVVEQIPQWRREHQERIRELDRSVIMAAVGGRINGLKKQYAEFPNVLEYLSAVEQSVVTNPVDFRGGEEGEENPLAQIVMLAGAREPGTQRRYQVNVIVDHSATQGAPVVYVDNPAYSELIGRVEHLAQMGALVTDFTLIKGGGLHRANGGYLILDALRLLQQPFAWEGLKRCLSAREIRIESLGQMLSLISTVSLEPEPVPLSVKIVLLGERSIYYLLHRLDPDFQKHFKVAADFNEDIPRDADSELLFAQLVATIGRRERIRPLDRGAVARLVEHGSRLAADSEKLSVRVDEVADLLREADYWAQQAQREVAQAADVERAIAARIYRSDRVRDLVQEAMRRGMLLIDTQGGKVAQVNGLSVAAVGDFAFGHPVRITARTRLGRGEVVDIEREVKLGGPIHSKGVLILSGFLGARYTPGKPLSLAASLVFEQTYGGVEGDSASCAEACALLSALAEAPIRQGLAITGSVNQHGDVQAIGGVNEKIEGFFDICKARGLTGEQGVLIPGSNVKDLMLRADVVAACGAGQFHVYPVATVDEAAELLTGVPAGERGPDGRFPAGTLNGRVEERLLQFSDQARAFTAHADAERTPAGEGQHD